MGDLVYAGLSVWRTWFMEDCVWRTVYGELGAQMAEYGGLDRKKWLATENSNNDGGNSEKEGMKLTSLAKKAVYLKISEAR